MRHVRRITEDIGTGDEMGGCRAAENGIGEALACNGVCVPWPGVEQREGRIEERSEALKDGDNRVRVCAGRQLARISPTVSASTSCTTILTVLDATSGNTGSNRGDAQRYRPAAVVVTNGRWAGSGSGVRERIGEGLVDHPLVTCTVGGRSELSA